MFGFWKAPRKEKNAKENSFLMFGFTIIFLKKLNTIKIS